MKMKAKLEILSLEKQSGVSKKSGNAYEIRKAHVVLHRDDGNKEVAVLMVPKDVPDPAPGVYEAEFGIAVDFQTRELRGVVAALHPAKLSEVKKAA
jgi:hypothetical protein